MSCFTHTTLNKYSVPVIKAGTSEPNPGSSDDRGESTWVGTS